MTKEILESITLLFAISVNKQVDYPANVSIGIYKDFLTDKIEAQYHNEFISFFNDKISSFSSSKNHKHLCLNSVRLIGICEKMKSKLSLKDRFELVFYLAKLIKCLDDNNLSLRFVYLVAELFDIEDKILNLLFDNLSAEKEIISRSIYYDNERVVELYYTEYNIILIKALSDNIVIDGKIRVPNVFCLFRKESILQVRGNKKYFYPELDSFLQADSLNQEGQIELSFFNLGVFKNNKTLLHNLDLKFKSGEIVGILGNSGSGKTTMLRAIYSVLSGNKKCGELLSSKANLSFGFVEQFSSFIPGFSLEELLERRADVLQIPKSRKRHEINALLSSFMLLEHSNKIVLSITENSSELSGGQIKRMEIANEMLASPDVLLLDEASTGLSSYDSINIFSLLKKLALENKIIISSIHQPDFDLFMMFDKIIIIDDYGYPIYFDSPINVADYFRKYLGRLDKLSLLENANRPSVIFNIIADKLFDNKGRELEMRKVDPVDWYKLFIKNNSEKNDTQLNDKNKCFKPRDKKINGLKLLVSNLRFLFKIEWSNKIRFSSLLLVPLICGYVFSALLKYSESDNYQFFYNPNVPIWIIVLLTTAVFVGMLDSGHEFILYRNFYLNESRLVKSLEISLLFSRVLKYLVISLFQALILVLPAVYLIRADFYFLHLFFVVWLLIFWGNVVGVVLSILFSNVTVVYIVSVLVLIPQMLFSGAMINFSYFSSCVQTNDYVPYIADFVPLRWASEAILTDFYINNPYEKKLFKYKCRLASVNYDLNYWLPFCEELYSKHSIFVNQELKRKIISLGIDYNRNMSKDEIINNLNLYFLRERDYYIHQFDSVIDNDACILSEKLLYTNQELSTIVSSYHVEEPIIFRDKKIIRRYSLIYISPYDFSSNRYFLIGLKKLNKYYISSYNYNFIILFLYCLALILLAYVLLVIKRIYSLKKDL